MFITRNRYVWLESCTSAGVYEAVMFYCRAPDGMEGARRGRNVTSCRYAWVSCMASAKVGRVLDGMSGNELVTCRSGRQRKGC